MIYDWLQLGNANNVVSYKVAKQAFWCAIYPFQNDNIVLIKSKKIHLKLYYVNMQIFKSQYNKLTQWIAECAVYSCLELTELWNKWYLYLFSSSVHNFEILFFISSQTQYDLENALS